MNKEKKKLQNAQKERQRHVVVCPCTTRQPLYTTACGYTSTALYSYTLTASPRASGRGLGRGYAYFQRAQKKDPHVCREGTREGRQKEKVSRNLWRGCCVKQFFRGLAEFLKRIGSDSVFYNREGVDVAFLRLEIVVGVLLTGLIGILTEFPNKRALYFLDGDGCTNIVGTNKLLDGFVGHQDGNALVLHIDGFGLRFAHAVYKLPITCEHRRIERISRFAPLSNKVCKDKGSSSLVCNGD